MDPALLALRYMAETPLDPSAVAQNGIVAALLVPGIVVLWRRLTKVQDQRDTEREVSIKALQSSTEAVSKAVDESIRNRQHNEERDRELVELRAELAGYRRGRS